MDIGPCRLKQKKIQIDYPTGNVLQYQTWELPSPDLHFVATPVTKFLKTPLLLLLYLNLDPGSSSRLSCPANQQSLHNSWNNPAIRGQSPPSPRCATRVLHAGPNFQTRPDPTRPTKAVTRPDRTRQSMRLLGPDPTRPDPQTYS